MAFLDFLFHTKVSSNTSHSAAIVIQISPMLAVTRTTRHYAISVEGNEVRVQTEVTDNHQRLLTGWAHYLN